MKGNTAEEYTEELTKKISNTDMERWSGLMEAHIAVNGLTESRKALELWFLKTEQEKLGSSNRMFWSNLLFQMIF